eukprot:340371_1
MATTFAFEDEKNDDDINPPFNIKIDVDSVDTNRKGYSPNLTLTPNSPRSPRVQYDHLVKVILVGDSGTGKSCMLLRFSKDQFNDTFITTIGVDFGVKTLDIDDKIVKLQIWDTAGQERFRTITCSYYRGAQAVCLIFDITDRQSFENIRNWNYNVEQHSPDNCMKFVIGSKVDLEDERVVSIKEGDDLAMEIGAKKYIEVSAKSGQNINQLFNTIALYWLHEIRNGLTAKPQETISIHVPFKKKRSCCNT